MIPRAALALLEAAIAGRIARGLPVPLDAGYARRALHSGRGAATRVVVYYSCALVTALPDSCALRPRKRPGRRPP